MDNYPYKVYDQSGRLVLQAAESCRYDRETERSLLESGHTIRLNGKRITKKEVSQRAENNTML